MFKRLIFLLVIGSGLVACRDDSAPEKQGPTETPSTVAYDSIRAARLGADDYGMRVYVMAFLKRGPNQDLPAEQASSLQQAHLKNIERLASEGKLSLAGPFMDSGEFRGIYIFNVTTLEEAEALTRTDPAIEAGVLEMELRPWYGSAALQEVNTAHQALSRKSITN